MSEHLGDFRYSMLSAPVKETLAWRGARPVAEEFRQAPAHHRAKENSPREKPEIEAVGLNICRGGDPCFPRLCIAAHDHDYGRIGGEMEPFPEGTGVWALRSRRVPTATVRSHRAIPNRAHRRARRHST